MHTVDLAAIGCGPFNLGLAALASTVPGLSLAVFESEREITWHRGLMFDDATLQVSFLADLVSIVDPTHPLSFLAYLREHDRMYAFYVRERFHLTRREYEHYLRWAASKLDSIRFGHRVESVEWDADRADFRLVVRAHGAVESTVHAKHLVIGIGTEPSIPDALAGLPRDRLVHAGDYLHRRAEIDAATAVTVVGSGQSGAEVMLDLLARSADPDEIGPRLAWLTRTESFAPLDYTKLVLEMTTPDYVRYFHALPEAQRDALVARQWRHYKGISLDTIDAIHDLLYRRTIEPTAPPVELRFGVAVEDGTIDDGQVVLHCRHADSRSRFEHRTGLVVAATGYRQRRPEFLRGVERFIRRDASHRPIVGLDHAIELDPAITGSIFVANADLHSHGVAAPDLGICAHRNATILNAVVGREVYRLPRRTAFTSFEPPTEGVRTGANPANERAKGAAWTTDAR